MGKKFSDVVKIFCLALVLVVPFGTASADETVDSIKEALEAYKAGDLAEAMSSLNYATQLIRQKKGELLVKFLPKPLPGWEAREGTSQSAGAAMFGGGTTAERKYNKGSSEITVTFMIDSPMIQSMLMMFSNPMFVGQDGKLARINRQKVIVKYEPQQKQGEITAVVDKRILVTVRGREVEKTDLEEYTKSIDFKGISSL